jgi:hypothetical protein
MIADLRRGEAGCLLEPDFGDIQFLPAAAGAAMRPAAQRRIVHQLPGAAQRIGHFDAGGILERGRNRSRGHSGFGDDGG